MFIKIDNEVFNTDHIVLIDFDSPRPCIYLTGDRMAWVSESAANYLIEMLETNTGYIPDSDTAQPESDLKARVAVLLRDTWKSGTCAQFASVLHEDEGLVLEALLKLVAEHVVYVDSENELQHLYYHATNRPKYLTPNPGLLNEGVEHGLIDLKADGNG